MTDVLVAQQVNSDTLANDIGELEFLWKPTESWIGNTGSDKDGNETRVYWFKNEKGGMRL